MKQSTKTLMMSAGVMTRIMREIMGSPKREIVGEEYDKVMTLLRLIGPSGGSNNQHSETEEYFVGDDENYTEYHLTYFPDGITELVEILKEENEKID